MLGNLNEKQIDNILLSQAVGRIGCVHDSQPYIVPVTYVYDGKEIYGQTHPGMKLDFMRKNPNVCFQVDIIVNMANWQSVLVTGTFHEVTGEEAAKARDYLYNRVYPLMTSSTVHAHEHEVNSEVADENRQKPVMYRIEIKDKSGRFEKS
jgi:nitroimidazol reductase NimA-like FMN-containing flavoprotein (pyridoxamine 5'-phosphate oxidase superfamily)